MTFLQDGASVQLRTNCPSALQDARETLYAYEPDPAMPARWTVLLHCGPVAVPGDADGVTGEPIEIGPNLSATMHPIPDGTQFWVPGLQTVITGHPSGAHITVRCASGDAARHWAARLVRQAMTAQLLAAGAVYAHAAALRYRDHGVVIAGHRRRGKTTTLLATLHTLGGDYVTNDRLLLRCADDGLIGHPWPVHLRAGIGTLSALPHLAELVREPLRQLPLAERWTYPEKVAVEPPDFHRLLRPGGTVANQIRPTVLLWPDLHPDQHNVVTERVAPQDVLTELLRTELFMTDPGRAVSAHVNHWLIPAPSPATTAAHRAAVADALADLPCYRIRAGNDPGALANAVRDVLDHVPARRTGVT